MYTTHTKICPLRKMQLRGFMQPRTSLVQMATQLPTVVLLKLLRCVTAVSQIKSSKIHVRLHKIIFPFFLHDSEVDYHLGSILHRLAFCFNSVNLTIYPGRAHKAFGAVRRLSHQILVQLILKLSAPTKFCCYLVEISPHGVTQPEALERGNGQNFFGEKVETGFFYLHDSGFNLFFNSSRSGHCRERIRAVQCRVELCCSTKFIRL